MFKFQREYLRQHATAALPVPATAATAREPPARAPAGKRRVTRRDWDPGRGAAGAGTASDSECQCGREPQNRPKTVAPPAAGRRMGPAAP
jgi:hypothetical protein